MGDVRTEMYRNRQKSHLFTRPVMLLNQSANFRLHWEQHPFENDNESLLAFMVEYPLLMAFNASVAS